MLGSSQLGAEEGGFGALGMLWSSRGGKRSEKRRRRLLCLKALGTTWREERKRGPGPAAHGTRNRLARLQRRLATAAGNIQDEREARVRA
jgi:hypothetical protein